MYIAQLTIKNFRCFRDTTIDFRPGINVIIGENNAGKTALLRALSMLFDGRSRRRLNPYDFNRQVAADLSKPPSVEISAVLRPSPDGEERAEELALVGTWLTTIEPQWEAQLTCQYFLPEGSLAEFVEAVGDDPTEETFWHALEVCLPKYVYRMYGGDPEAKVRAESETLSKIGLRLLDAIRDVETELFSGSNPLLRTMLLRVLDAGDDRRASRSAASRTFRKDANALCDSLIGRLDFASLMRLMEDTGAHKGGTPKPNANLTEHDLIAAIKLFIARAGLELPASHNGLGYNNLVYIALVLASTDAESRSEELGENALVFPLLAIEEPEAHLHPALQYQLLKYLKGRVTAPTGNRQIFITSHSTQITSAAGLDPIVCLSLADDESTVSVAYPARAFGASPAGHVSKSYVERYLDATKSAMLFAKGVLFVEGIAELLLMPALAEIVDAPIEKHHVAVIAVQGLTFKHFLPLFGGQACGLDSGSYGLGQRVACLIDADPSRPDADGSTRVCYPYEIVGAAGERPVSPTAQALQSICTTAANIRMFHGRKTLEYDLAFDNAGQNVLFTSACTNRPKLESLHTLGESEAQALVAARSGAAAEAALAEIGDDDERRRHRFATYYLACTEDAKGEHAFELTANIGRLDDSARIQFVVPNHIRDAIRWSCGVE